MGTPNIEPVYVLLGAKIAHIRTNLGMTQTEFGKIIGQTRASVANMENGKQRIHLHTLEQLAKAFSMSPKHFLKGIWV